MTPKNSLFIRNWNTLMTNEDKLILLKGQIKFLYVNKELITFFEKLLATIPDINQKKLVLLFARKIVLQYYRPIPQDVRDSLIEEDQLKEFEREQLQYNPDKWIDCELEYLLVVGLFYQADIGFKKLYNAPTEGELELMTLDQAMDFMHISKSTLDRRRADGLPSIKTGKKIYFKKSDIINWLNQSQL